MIRSLVFDKDGVILDLVGTWFPVMLALADYTLTLQPDPAARGLTRVALLDAVGVDDASGHIDPLGVQQNAFPHCPIFARIAPVFKGDFT